MNFNIRNTPGSQATPAAAGLPTTPRRTRSQTKDPSDRPARSQTDTDATPRPRVRHADCIGLIRVERAGPMNPKPVFDSSTKARKPAETRPTETREYPPLPGPNTPYMTLKAILSVTPPIVPSLYKKDALKGTTSITKSHTTLLMPGKDILEWVVPFPQLMDPLFEWVYDKIRNFPEINANELRDRDWLSTVHPGFTSLRLPNVINSEKDIESWAMPVIFRAALTACRALELGRVEIEQGEWPNITSSDNCGDSIPDGLLHKIQNDIRALVEIKTPGAMKAGTFDDLLLTWPGMPVGHAVHFGWPADPASMSRSIDRIIAQVWSQTVERKVNLATLSNYSSVIFFFRHERTLYMSGEYTRDAKMIFSVFAFFTFALGLAPEGILKFPPPKAYCGNGNVDHIGLDPTTYPKAMKHVLDRNPHLNYRPEGFEFVL